MSQQDRVKLNTHMQQRLSSSEVQQAAFDLGIDYDNLPGDTKAAKIRELIGYMDRRQQLDKIVEWLRSNRPDINLAEPVQGGQPVSPVSPPPVPPATTTPRPVSIQTTPTPTTRRTWEYDDFDVAIDDKHNDAYTIRVFKSRAGEVSAQSVLSNNDTALIDGLAALKTQLVDPAKVQALGARLLNALLNDDVNDAFRVSLARADERKVGLRIRLRIGPPALKRLPWEFIYDTRTASYLAARNRVVVSRYLENLQGVGDVPRPDQLKMLVILSSPDGVDKLDLDQEQQRISAAVKRVVDSGQMAEPTYLVNPSSSDIRGQLVDHVYHIVHYAGHAFFADTDTVMFGQPVRANTGYVGLPGDGGYVRLLDEDAFALFFADYNEIRLIVLNACASAQTSATTRLSGLGDRLVIQANVPAVVAMQFPIPNPAAGSFASEFYASIARGLPIDAAVAQARLALYQDRGPNDRAWGTPVLFMRAPDGRLFA